MLHAASPVLQNPACTWSQKFSPSYDVCSKGKMNVIALSHRRHLPAAPLETRPPPRAYRSCSPHWATYSQGVAEGRTCHRCPSAPGQHLSSSQHNHSHSAVCKRGPKKYHHQWSASLWRAEGFIFLQHWSPLKYIPSIPRDTNCKKPQFISFIKSKP